MKSSVKQQMTDLYWYPLSSIFFPAGFSVTKHLCSNHTFSNVKLIECLTLVSADYVAIAAGVGGWGLWWSPVLLSKLAVDSWASGGLSTSAFIIEDLCSVPCSQVEMPAMVVAGHAHNPCIHVCATTPNLVWLFFLYYLCVKFWMNLLCFVVTSRA